MNKVSITTVLPLKNSSVNFLEPYFLKPGLYAQFCF